MAITKQSRRLRIRRGIRNKISGSNERPRLSVFKSNRGIYAQIINDDEGHTVVQSSSKDLGENKGVINIAIAKEVGLKLAQKAKEQGVETVIFDRGGYPYHGKVKALAEGAREGGLVF